MALLEHKMQDLLYWIKERESVRLKKEAGDSKPWSNNRIFRTTYFCNVDRENDKVTKWIRNFYSPEVNSPNFMYNIILARLLNRPETLDEIGYLLDHNGEYIEAVLRKRESRGEKIWGGAYLITTHGQKMDKITYLIEVLEEAYKMRLETQLLGWSTQRLSTVHALLTQIDGIGDFLSGQVLADLKNTPGHPLVDAEDWKDFVVMGPGSSRGLGWIYYGTDKSVGRGFFRDYFPEVRDRVRVEYPNLCAQNIQNCLCEFDKYQRVLNGTGRSKRSYDGG